MTAGWLPADGPWPALVPDAAAPPLQLPPDAVSAAQGYTSSGQQLN